MMTHAYQEIYLDNAQSVLGDAFDYAVNVLSKPEISMHLKDTNLDVFELADKIYNYLKNGKQ